MPNKLKKPVFNLDAEEQQLSDSFDRGEWVSVDKRDDHITKAQEPIKNNSTKDTQINIRISSSDLEHIKQLATQKGLPYQTFIASILHKYSAGHFN